MIINNVVISSMFNFTYHNKLLMCVLSSYVYGEEGGGGLNGKVIKYGSITILL